MSGAKNHDYHLVDQSVWPLIGSIAALVMFFGLVTWWSPDVFGEGVGPIVFGLGVAGVIATFYFWWADVIREAHSGDHTPVVQLHLRYGMLLFIASEVMFFVGWFWAWFDFSLFPVPIEVCRRCGHQSTCSVRTAPIALMHHVAAEGDRSDRSVLRSAVAQHVDPALLGHH